MPTPPLSDELAQQAINAVTQYGGIMQAADKLNLPYSRLRRRFDVAKQRGLHPKITRDWSGNLETGKVVLAIGDMHHPFAHPDTLAFLTAAKKKFAPDVVVCLGDEVDQHALSQYDPDPDGYSAGHELLKSLDALKPIYQLFPDVRVCTSNHGVRPFKKAYRAGIPKAYLKSYAQFLEAPAGWIWADRWVVDGVVYEHGEGVSGQLGAIKKATANMRSTVIGHLHSDAGVVYFNNGEREIYGFNAGCLVDAKSYALSYGKHSIRKPILGVGMIENGVPHFFPMGLTAAGAWNGKL